MAHKLQTEFGQPSSVLVEPGQLDTCGRTIHTCIKLVVLPRELELWVVGLGERWWSISECLLLSVMV